MRHDNATKLSSIVNLATPSNAPLTIRFSIASTRIIQSEWRRSFPGGESKERGGTIVADASGRLSIQNLGGLHSTKKAFWPNYVLTDTGKFTIIGILHTHPYDKSEGSWNGVSISGGDFANLINGKHAIIVVRSGPRLFAFVRTAQSPATADFKTLNDQQNEINKKLQIEGKTFPQSTRISAEMIAPKYGLAYYQGSNGVLTRVSPH